MPTLKEFDAARKGQAPQGAVASPGDELLTESSLGPQYAPGLGDSPDSAFIHELARTGKEAGIGLLRSPLDLVKNTFNTVAHPLDTLMGLAHTVAHPVDSAMALAKNPREAGSLLGQTLLAPKMPEAANTALAKAPGMAGRAVSATGRGMEAVGTSKALKSVNKYGALGTAVSGHPGLALLELAAPPALEYGGRALQRGGAALEGLDLAYKGNIPTPFARTAEAEPVDPAMVMREKVAGARGDVSAGFSRPVAAKLNGLKSSATDISYPTQEVVNPGELFPYQRDAIQGLEDARNAAKAPKSPIEQFYENDPQARIGGEGRMTGQFEEGEGGLRDISSGNYERNPSPPRMSLSPLDRASVLAERYSRRYAGEPWDTIEADPRMSLAEDPAPAAAPELDSRISGLPPNASLDELSRLSGRQASPARMQELLDKLGGRGR